MGDEPAPAEKRLQVEVRDAHGRADHKNRSTMRTWGLMLYASMVLFLSVPVSGSSIDPSSKWRPKIQISQN